MSIDDLGKKIDVFINLIECYLNEDPTFVPLVTTSKNSIVILDGFHRMSVLTYFSGDVDIRTNAEWIIYPIRNSSDN